MYNKKMRTARYIFLTVALLTGSFAQAAERDKTFGTIKDAKYVRNYDGDSITMNLPGLHPILGKEITIRVAGVDTPEIRGKCQAEKNKAKEAKRLVNSILKDAEQIQLHRIGRGKYFRILADVHADGKDLGSTLIDSGLAVKYHGGTKTKDWCGSSNTTIEWLKKLIF